MVLLLENKVYSVLISPSLFPLQTKMCACMGVYMQTHTHTHTHTYILAKYIDWKCIYILTHTHSTQVSAWGNNHTNPDWDTLPKN